MIPFEINEPVSDCVSAPGTLLSDPQPPSSSLPVPLSFKQAKGASVLARSLELCADNSDGMNTSPVALTSDKSENLGLID